MSIRIVSYGGGIQSTAMLVLASQGKLGPITATVFANTGDDSESPHTVAYVKDHARPFAALHGIEFVEVNAGQWPTGDPRTLLSHVQAYNGCQACGVGPDDECVPACPSSRNTGGDMPIPLKVEPSGMPVSRSCTRQWKVEPIREWLISEGATEADPAEIMIGISVDEIERATNKPRHPAEFVTYPLLDLGLTRQECGRIVAAAGLPVPKKSACWFCPFHTPRSWAERRRDDPATFRRAVELEDGINTQRRRRNLAPLRFIKNRPLADTPEAQAPLFNELGDAGCDEGYCWT